ncbi:MAG: hypothetical protein ACTSQF_09125 [Candidatus Heimdallarchaeaceae archaeon]
MKLNVTKWKEKPDTEYSEDGLVRKNTSKPEYGSMMVTSSEVTITRGFANTRKKIGFISGTIQELSEIISRHNLVEGSDFSALVAPHRIAVIETVQSELNGELGFSEKMNPKTGQILAKDGEVIYRKTEVVPQGSDIVDILITHDKETDTADNAVSEFEKSSNVIKEL